MFTVLSLMGGLMFLAMGAYALIRGTAGLAQLAGVTPFLIGLVVVSFGSSTPQFFTALQATRTGAEDMALATAIGASIFNIFATLGVVALTGGAVHLNKRLWLRGSVALMAMAVITVCAILYYGSAAPLPRWVGAIGILTLIGYVITVYRYDNNQQQPLTMLKEARKFPPVIIAGLFLAGLFGISLGAILMVDAATQLTQLYNLNPIFLGLTVLAVGTALPQLIGAFRTFGDKQQHGLLLSNLIGNTIFNLLGVCGVLFMLNPMQFNQGGLLRTSFVVLAAATIAFAIFTHPAMRRFKRAEAILFLLAYALYIAYVLHSLS